MSILTEHNLAPLAGGWLDQESRFCDAVNECRAELRRIGGDS